MSDKTQTPTPLPRSNAKLVTKLLLTTLGMFCFAVFLLPPLYDVFCDITGLNGKYDTGRRAIAQPPIGNDFTVSTPAVDSHTNTEAQDRLITVQFVADASSNVSWPFFPKTRSLKVSPGTIHQVFFRVENPKAARIVARAIPSISPAQASLYMKKTQCFCFNEQPLAPFEGKDMGLVFYIDPEIPEDVHELTLSYRLYDITDSVSSPASAAINLNINHQLSGV